MRLRLLVTVKSTLTFRQFVPVFDAAVKRDYVITIVHHP
jgi:hypothetical protein